MGDIWVVFSTCNMLCRWLHIVGWIRWNHICNVRTNKLINIFFVCDVEGAWLVVKFFFQHRMGLYK